MSKKEKTDEQIKIEFEIECLLYAFRTARRNTKMKGLDLIIAVMKKMSLPYQILKVNKKVKKLRAKANNVLGRLEQIDNE